MAFPRARRPIATRVAIVLLSIAAMACHGARAEPQDANPSTRGERIAELRQAIDRDHATLEALITRPVAEDDGPLYEDPEMRAIAARLTTQVNALERLEAAEKAAR